MVCWKPNRIRWLLIFYRSDEEDGTSGKGAELCREFMGNQEGVSWLVKRLHGPPWATSMTLSTLSLVRAAVIQNGSNTPTLPPAPARGQEPAPLSAQPLAYSAPSAEGPEP